MFGLAESPPKLGKPRILGTKQGPSENDHGIAGGSDDKQGVLRDRRRTYATPLQH